MLKLPKDISMSELKFALIGKNISHSKSKEIYESLLGKNLDYQLIDIERPELLPDLSLFKNQFRGINITSPYKKSYLNQVELTDEAKKVQAINCLYFTAGKIFGTNTDYLGIRDFFKVKNSHVKFHCVILGDGVMANCTKIVLNEFDYKYDQYSRKINGDISKVDLSGIKTDKQILIINCCARDFVFQGKLPSGSWFWDLNYNFTPHQNSPFLKSALYLDGIDLLKTQAAYALKFWEL